MNFNDKARTWDDDPMKLTRALAVADGIRARVPLPPGIAGLEYGCGTGLLSFALQPYLSNIVLADSSDGMLSVLQEKIASRGIENMSPLKLDLVTDPLPEERFGIAFSLMTFHHIPDTDRIMRDLFSLLAAPGYLCIADLDSEDGSFHGPAFSGHKGFDRAALERSANEAGFQEVTFSTVFNINKPESAGQQDFPVFLMVARKPAP